MPPRNRTAAAATEFLGRHVPFNRMSEEALAFLVKRLARVGYAKEATILAAHTGPVGQLYIVERGLVGSRPNSVQSEPDRTLGPGEMFPVGALSAGGTTTKVFWALEETECYVLARDDFVELRKTSP
ncbi:MAG TPA: cyclic nucleotide-binding domain-containing protein, partial [Casimicrobiaceae bacterium]|nr:cyclic nucleotide-binding domain-containing protein [Casimicrobiaceae bacterium]